MPYNLAILKNENDKDHLEWVKACESRLDQVRYRIINITDSNWLDKVLEDEFDILLTRAPDKIGFFKQLYDERIYILNQVLKKSIYPNLDEILIYENKRMLSYWLKVNHIPHPKTWIFYHKNEAIDFSSICSLPMVAKTAIGASGSGVKILRKRKDLVDYINLIFSGKGIVRKWGPNLRKGDLGKRLVKRLKNIPDFICYINQKKFAATFEPQKWFVIFQEYIDNDFEWRCVRIGNSFFGHKKLSRIGEMKSGTSDVSWDTPSEMLLNFVKDITDKSRFLSQAVDIFEPESGKFLVNEMQCFWGSKNPHQMIVDGTPGRYVYEKPKWIFEEGRFNTNNSYDLRLTHVLEILNKKH